VKLPPHAFRIYWDAHAWAGIALAIIVNAMFFTGIFALFRDEIFVWQDPRAHLVEGCEGALDEVIASATDAAGFTVRAATVSYLDAGCAPLRVSLSGQDAGGAAREATLTMDRRAGPPLAPRSVVGTFLFYFHFFYEPRVLGRGGMIAAGLVGAWMLLVLVTGVLVHLKDLRRQLHQMRADRGRRVAWSDAHKVLGVMGLPFQTLMVLTGSIVCLATPIAMLWSQVVFGGDTSLTRAALFDRPAPATPTGEAVPGWRSLDALLADAEAAVPGLRPRSIRLRELGDASAEATVAGRAPGLFGDAEVTLSAVDGRVRSVRAPGRERTMRTALRWIYGFHFAWIGGVAARVLYALLGLLGCATILSGSWVWLERRDRERRRRGHRILGKVTVGLGLGIATAVGAMFAVNRIVPMSAPWHADAEVAAFVLGWLAALGVGLASDERRGATRVLALTAALFGLAVSLGALRTPLHLFGALAHGAHAIVTVELLLLSAAALAGVGAWALGRRRG